MKKFAKGSTLILALLSVLIAGGCSDDSSNPVSNDSGIYFDISNVDYSAVSVDESSLAPGAKQVAAQCAQCHGTYGVAAAGWPSLWGGDRNITRAMTQYADPDLHGDSAMHIHSLITYTLEDIDLINSYYNKVTYTAEGGE